MRSVWSTKRQSGKKQPSAVKYIYNASAMDYIQDITCVHCSRYIAMQWLKTVGVVNQWPECQHCVSDF